MAAPEVLSQVETVAALQIAQDKIVELERNKATGAQLQVLSRQITTATEAMNTAKSEFSTQAEQAEQARQSEAQQLIAVEQASVAKEQLHYNEVERLQSLRVQEEQANAEKLKQLTGVINGKVDPEDLGVFATNAQFTSVTNDLAKKADAQAVSSALDLTNTGLVNLRTDYTGQKRIRGTETQTVTGKMRVSIRHGIPPTATVPATSRTPKLNAVTEVASNWVKASVDADFIHIDYDIAVNSGPNGWIVQWEL